MIGLQLDLAQCSVLSCLKGFNVRSTGIPNTSTAAFIHAKFISQAYSCMIIYKASTPIKTSRPYTTGPTPSTENLNPNPRPKPKTPNHHKLAKMRKKSIKNNPGKKIQLGSHNINNDDSKQNCFNSSIYDIYHLWQQHDAAHCANLILQSK